MASDSSSTHVELSTSIQAIIFDLDGTLLDTESISDWAMFASLPIAKPMEDSNETKDQQRSLLPWDLKRQILGLRSSDWGPVVLGYAHNVWKVPLDKLPSVQQLASDWEENMNRYCDQIHACSGAPELVEKLAQLGVPMALATSSRQASVDRKRKNHERIFRHLTAIVCGDHPAVCSGKPAPDIYIEAARQLGVHPSCCLVFEDALTGVRSAKAAGCVVVAVPDQRFDDNEMSVFAKEADVVLPNLWHFSGKPYGLPLEMSSADTM